MNLVVDAGNSNVKLGLFEEGSLTHTFVCANSDFEKEWESLLSPYFSDIKKTAVANVGPLNIAELLSSRISDMTVITIENKFPFAITYKSKATLGIDRLIGCTGASKLSNNSNCLVIDIGTCITYDYLVENCFLGGAISPGIRLRSKSMSEHTANLPEVSMDKNEQLSPIGNSTSNALKTGIYHGILNEIAGNIQWAKTQHPGINVFLTGGQLDFFEEALKNDIFAERNLVLHGLDHILSLNA